MLEHAEPYLPQSARARRDGALDGWRHRLLPTRSADGIVDISPFTCMNGIVTEAVYPRVSKDHDNIPIRVFYFDGTHSDLDRDVGIFLELAKTYKRRKKVESRSGKMTPGLWECRGGRWSGVAERATRRTLRRSARSAGSSSRRWRGSWPSR